VTASTIFTIAEYQPPHLLGILAAAEPKEHHLWVPKTFAKHGKVYILPATHQDDMYHVRGAMTLESHPLIVYKCTDKTKELTDYLAKTAPDAFLTRWTWDQLSGGINPGDFHYCKREKKTKI
jgi:hypothetical protein